MLYASLDVGTIRLRHGHYRPSAKRTLLAVFAACLLLPLSAQSSELADSWPRWSLLPPRTGPELDTKTCLEHIDPELAAAIPWPRPKVPGMVPVTVGQYIAERDRWIGHESKSPIDPDKLWLVVYFECG